MMWRLRTIKSTQTRGLFHDQNESSYFPLRGTSRLSRRVLMSHFIRLKPGIGHINCRENQMQTREKVESPAGATQGWFLMDGWGTGDGGRGGEASRTAWICFLVHTHTHTCPLNQTHTCTLKHRPTHTHTHFFFFKGLRETFYPPTRTLTCKR